MHEQNQVSDILKEAVNQIVEEVEALRISLGLSDEVMTGALMGLVKTYANEAQLPLGRLIATLSKDYPPKSNDNQRERNDTNGQQ